VWVRTTLRAEAVRTADRYYEEAEEDAVEGHRRLLDGDPRAAVVGLKRSAAGCRWLIVRWEYLERKLADDGTLYGGDRIEAIQLQGLSAFVDDLYICEDAYMTWLNALAAQPDPKQPDINLVLDRQVMPKSIQDRGGDVWRPDPAASRAALAMIVTRELAFLRARAELLRVKYEEPARAEAQQKALARLAQRKDEVALLRAQRSHEQAYQRASLALLKVRAGLVAAGLRHSGRPMVRQDKLIAGPAPIAQPASRGCEPPDTSASPSPGPRHPGVDIPGSPGG
jgi:hypothetical protein